MGGRPSRRLRDLAEQYAALLRTAFGSRLVAVVLHGAGARGEAGPDTPLEILIVADHSSSNGPFTRKDLLAAADTAFEALLAAARMDGVETCLRRVLRTPQQAREIAPQYLDMTEDAILLYDPAGFFTRLLDELRASLEQLGARRVREAGAWYWELADGHERGRGTSG